MIGKLNIEFKYEKWNAHDKDSYDLNIIMIYECLIKTVNILTYYYTNFSINTSNEIINAKITIFFGILCNYNMVNIFFIFSTGYVLMYRYPYVNRNG